MNETQRAWIDGLRDIAAWFEEHPDQIPEWGGLARIDIDTPDDADGAYLTSMAKILDGEIEKDETPSYFWICRRFGPHSITAAAPREAVCERVVTVVTEEVTEPVGEDTRPMETKTVEREVVEWKCPPSILALGQSS